MTHRPLGEGQTEAQRLRGLLPLALAYDALPVRVVEEFATI